MKPISTIMNTQIGSSLPSEKLDQNNFAYLEYKMHQYLATQGYWSNIERAQEMKPNSTHADYPTCHVYMITCLATFEKPRCRKKLGRTSIRSSCLIRLKESFNFVDS